MGKGLAEFRKASDDFKRTWEREVALESARADENSLLEAPHQPVNEPQTFNQPVIETPNSEWVVPRESVIQTSPEAATVTAETTQAETGPVRKQEWI
jgi:hypothetical protein